MTTMRELIEAKGQPDKEVFKNYVDAIKRFVSDYESSKKGFEDMTLLLYAMVKMGASMGETVADTMDKDGARKMKKVSTELKSLANQARRI